MKMALSVPLADIMAYRKVGKAFFGLLDVLCSNHTSVIANYDTPTFAFLMTALDSGLKSLDVVISSQCATAVDNLAGFYFKAVQANGGETPPAAAQVPPFVCHEYTGDKHNLSVEPNPILAFHHNRAGQGSRDLIAVHHGC